MSSTKQRKRKLRKNNAIEFGDGTKQQFVKLTNPVANHFPSFVIGNVLAWEAMVHDELLKDNPQAAEALEPFEGLLGMYAGEFSDPIAATKWREFVGAVTEHCKERHVVEKDSGVGKTLMICGAGPSLADNIAEYAPKCDQIWCCNSALPWVIKNGYKATHGFTVDQTPQMIEEWQETFDVEYLLATTVHSHLTGHLLAENRKVRFFHNYVGIQGEDVSFPDENGEIRSMMYEDWMYSALMPGTVKAGSGLNATTRAVDVAMYAGFEKIYLLGADCALRINKPAPDAEHGSPEHLQWLRENVVMHVDGGHALASGATATTMRGIIDGRHWESKADLMISAVWLVRMQQKIGDTLEIIGDTLPNAIKDKGNKFLNRLPMMVDSQNRPILVP